VINKYDARTIDSPKNPCSVCEHRYEDKKRTEPCKNCPLPARYDDALNNHHFPIVKFLRHSKPKHWGLTQKEIEEMEGKKHKEIMQPYCDDEGVEYEDIISKARTPELSAARRNIAQVMSNHGFENSIIALRLNLAVPTVWGYLNPEKKEDPVNDENNKSENIPPDTEPDQGPEKPNPGPDTGAEKQDTEPEKQYPGKLEILIDFKKRPEVYESLLLRAEEELREPEQQALWFFIKLYEKTLET